MKINEILSESKVRPYKFEDLQIKKAVQLLNTHCRESLALIYRPIWRGMSNHNKPIVYIDAETGKRKSNNTYNYYTELIDHSPYFKGWPRRSHSLICSTSYKYASSYSASDTYAIFPFDGTKIAVCPKQDIWETNIRLPSFDVVFTGTNNNLPRFNWWLRDDLGFSSDEFKSMVVHANSHEILKRLKRLRIKIPSNQIIPDLQLALSPQKTGFKLMTIQEFVNTPLTNKEVWIGGKIIAINKNLYQQFLDAVTKRNKE